MKLNIGQLVSSEKSFTLPLDFITQTTAIVAKKGSGKTYCAMVITEEILKNNGRVIVIDPLGVWHGLRSSANGKKAGYEILILGGEHSDLPLLEESGELISNLIIDENISCILDLSLFRKKQQTRFLTPFFENLYHKNRNAVHVMVDECDSYAPQKAFEGEQRLLGAMEDLVRRGRSRGIGLTMITQRSAVINKNLLTQAELLIAFRTISPQDRKAIESWIEAHDVYHQKEKFMESLASLPIGTGWFWCPGWLDVFELVKIRKKETFDSSSTPEIGKTSIKPKRIAELNLKSIESKMKSVVEKAKENNPSELKKRIFQLEKELKQTKQPVIQQPAKEKIVEVKIPALTDTQLKSLEKISIRLEGIVNKIKTTVNRPNKKPEASLHIITGKSNLDELHKSFKLTMTPKNKIEGNDFAIGGNKNIKIGNSEKRILIALAQNPEGCTKGRISLLVCLSARGGSFNTYLSRLRSWGFIEGQNNGTIKITQLGLENVGEYEPLPVGQDLINYWIDKLGSTESKIFSYITSVYPNTTNKEEIGNKLELSHTGGSFNTYISRLRSLKLIEGSNELKASDEFFI